MGWESTAFGVGRVPQCRHAHILETIRMLATPCSRESNESRNSPDGGRHGQLADAGRARLCPTPGLRGGHGPGIGAFGCRRTAARNPEASGRTPEREPSDDLENDQGTRSSPRRDRPRNLAIFVPGDHGAGAHGHGKRTSTREIRCLADQRKRFHRGLPSRLTQAFLLRGHFDRPPATSIRGENILRSERFHWRKTTSGTTSGESESFLKLPKVTAG